MTSETESRSLSSRLREWARAIQADALTLWYATRHPRTPILAKVLAAGLVVYAFSPIDLIPDFIPVLGLLDDAIILPLGIMLVVRLVPEDVLQDCRASAIAHVERGDAQPRSVAGLLVIVAIWVGVGFAVLSLLNATFRAH